MTVSDGYGDELTAHEMSDLLPQYELWLHKVANYFTGWAWEAHDDLVQEGRIAMWQAYVKKPPEAPTAPWITNAARMRMKDCLRRNLWTGQPSTRGHTRASSPLNGVTRLGNDPHDHTYTVLSLMDDDWSLEQMLTAAQLTEGVELAYHRGEIFAAIASLSPQQQRYVVLRFWLGLEGQNGGGRKLAEMMGTEAPHVYWTARSRGARDRLRAQLSHLVDV